MSLVEDFSYALSLHRNAAGKETKNGNNNAQHEALTGVSAWITSAATSMKGLFYGAKDMNADVGGWDTSKVTTLESMFSSAPKFTGVGLSKWNVVKVTTLAFTFMGAAEMNANMGGWGVGKVTTMENAFTFCNKLSNCNKKVMYTSWGPAGLKNNAFNSAWSDFNEVICSEAPTCGNKDGVGSGAVSDSECGDGYDYDSTKSATACASSSKGCAPGSDPDRAACCKQGAAVATCGNKDGKGGGAVSNSECDSGGTYLYNSAASKTQCAGNPCKPGSVNSDRTACCVARATCGDKDGAGSYTAAVSDSDCTSGRTGYKYDTNANKALCAGASCAAGNTGADKTTCCFQQATCGDKDGAGANTAAVSDSDCASGGGYKYKLSAKDALCAGAACAASNTACVAASSGSWIRAPSFSRDRS